MVADHMIAHMVGRRAEYKLDCKVVRMVDPNSVHKAVAVAVEDIQIAVDIAVVEQILY